MHYYTDLNTNLFLLDKIKFVLLTIKTFVFMANFQ